MDTILSVKFWGVAFRRQSWRAFAGRLTPKRFGRGSSRVEDTLQGMQQLAAAVLRTWREAKPERRVAAVAGSVGKTTTKEILAALLGARFRVLKSPAI